MKIILSLAASAAAFVALPVAAQQPASAPRTIVVRTAGLDLATPSGVAALDRRISVAVRDVCGPASDVDLHGKNLVQQCRADTLASVERQREAAIALAARPASTSFASQ